MEVYGDNIKDYQNFNVSLWTYMETTSRTLYFYPRPCGGMGLQMKKLIFLLLLHA